jgi:hypothetical protein
LLLLVAKQLWHAYELRFLPFAVVLIVGAHVLNYRLSRPAAAAGKQVEIPDNESLVRSGDQAA